MRIFRILYFKELRSYFLSPFGWLVIAFAGLVQAFILTGTIKQFADEAQGESLVFMVFNSPFFWFYFLILFPVLTMRLFSEESRSGTLEGLLTAPLRSWQVVLSKFSAAYTTFMTLWVPALIHFYLFTSLTDVPPPFTWAEVAGAMTGVAMMGLLFTAFGCLASALTSSQIIAAIVCTAILIVHFLLGLIPSQYSSQLDVAQFFNFMGSQNHMRDFARGLIDTRPIAYYLSTTFFILLVTYHLFDFRRWKP
ncbi:MAG: ABC transporter permease subunit [Akkermansiaceae bacterium]|jgi:ABC-2 type transport system permease protein